MFAATFTTTTVSMRSWTISLVLLLLTATAIANKDVLNVDAFDTSIKREDGTGKAKDEMSWEAAEELIDAVKEFGNITRNVNCILP